MSHRAHAATTSPGTRRGMVVRRALLSVAAVTACAAGQAQPAAAAQTSASSQPLVLLQRDHVARATPSVKGDRRAIVTARRPLTRVRTVLPVLGRSTSADGRAWLHVALPGRPNGSTGWITADGTRASSTGWRLSVSLAARRVTVFDEGHAVRRFRAVVGAPSTPTPRGRFFIEEALALGGRAAGGPYALATSARSNVFQEFEGGPGQIALHGTDHLAGALGTASSHGCVRLSTAAITWLAGRIGAGVPLTIA